MRHTVVRLCVECNSANRHLRPATYKLLVISGLKSNQRFRNRIERLPALKRFSYILTRPICDRISGNSLEIMNGSLERIRDCKPIHQLLVGGNAALPFKKPLI